MNDSYDFQGCQRLGRHGFTKESIYEVGISSVGSLEHATSNQSFLRSTVLFLFSSPSFLYDALNICSCLCKSGFRSSCGVWLMYHTVIIVSSLIKAILSLLFFLFRWFQQAATLDVKEMHHSQRKASNDVEHGTAKREPCGSWAPHIGVRRLEDE